MFINRKGPTQSGSAKHFWNVGYWDNVGLIGAAY